MKKTKKFYVFVNTIEGNKKYPVRYWIDNTGVKHYQWKLLKGSDLTENQIYDLYKFLVPCCSRQIQYAVSNALYDTGKLTVALRDEITVGILKYLKEINLVLPE